MDFLTLCAKLATRSGAASAPSTVTGQTNRKAKVVDWTAEAWEDIQRLHDDWSFLQGTWAGETVGGQFSYSAEDFGIDDRFAEWKIDRTIGRRFYRPVILSDPAIGVADEGTLSLIGYEDWIERYATGTQTENKPVHYAIAPDQTIRLGPIPNGVYDIRGEYRKAPQLLEADDDEPDMPARFHDIIVARALILMAEHDEAVAALQGAIRTFNDRLNAMRRDLLPEITTRTSR